MFKSQEKIPLHYLIERYNKIYHEIKELNSFEAELENIRKLQNMMESLAEVCRQLTVKYKIKGEDPELFSEKLLNLICSKQKELVNTYASIETALQNGENPNEREILIPTPLSMFSFIKTPTIDQNESPYHLHTVEDPTLLKLLLEFKADRNLKSHFENSARSRKNKVYDFFTPTERALSLGQYHKALVLASSNSPCMMTNDTILSSLKFMTTHLNCLSKRDDLHPNRIKQILVNYDAEIEIIDVLLNKAKGGVILSELLNDLNTSLLKRINALSQINIFEYHYECFNILIHLDLFLRVRSKIIEQSLPFMLFAFSNLSFNMPSELKYFILKTVLQVWSEIDPPAIDTTFFINTYTDLKQKDKKDATCLPFNNKMSDTDILLCIIDETKNRADWHLLNAWKLTLFKFINFTEKKERGFGCTFDLRLD